MNVELNPHAPMDWLAAALYEWWRDMDENRMPTGFRVRVADTTTGPSGVAWPSLNFPQKRSVIEFVCDTVRNVYGPADDMIAQDVFGMTRDMIRMSRSHVASLAALILPDQEKRRRLAAHASGKR